MTVRYLLLLFFFYKLTETNRKIFIVAGSCVIGVIVLSTAVMLALRGRRCCNKRYIFYILQKTLYIYTATSKLSETKYYMYYVYSVKVSRLKQ